MTMQSAIRQMNMRHSKPSADTAPPLGAETFGSLINLAGRQRMLSQRIILNTILASQGDQAAKATAQEALQLFTATHHDLVHGNQQLPGLFSLALQDAYLGDSKADARIRAFIEHAGQALQALDANTPSTVLIDRLGQYATPMVTILNQITQVYENEARQHASLHQKQQRDLMENIQRITKQAKIVSVNAKIIAARAGEAGKEFSVVASVLANITSELDELVLQAVKNGEYHP
ncbi:type IV pili methyl-accepting chemotaxis transducer N-terminal domain-containing protein [Methylobacillus flagellatus]|nr:type IV pili methyl-accepting chemotaxis transducer N-terminal domain-containing protein [Methylobacillus flagellatus]